jgi:hypothetical protein
MAGISSSSRHTAIGMIMAVTGHWTGESLDVRYATAILGQSCRD